MRNISFSLTTSQIRERSKTVTRRLGWKHLKAGDRLQGCVKCMGLKPGEKLEKLAVIEVVKVDQVQLDAILFDVTYQDDPRKEGFPEMTPRQFMHFFCVHMKVTPETEVTRIEFKYVDP